MSLFKNGEAGQAQGWDEQRLESSLATNYLPRCISALLALLYENILNFICTQHNH